MLSVLKSIFCMVGGEGVATKVPYCTTDITILPFLTDLQARFHNERLFRLIDLDGDGFLTESEFIGVQLFIL